MATEPKVELYHIANKSSCTLPDIPENNGKWGHTSVGGVICGGQATGSLDGSTTCLDITSGAWTSSNYQPLISRHADHVSWNLGLDDSFMLLGGSGFPASSNATSIVKSDGTNEVGFMMQYSIT